MRPLRAAAAVAVSAPAAGMALLLVMALAVSGGDVDPNATPVGSVGCTLPGGTAGTLDADQSSNAAVIVQVAKERKVPEYGWVIALATALQESGLRNINYGDRDSLGLFQQRPSQGWGTAQQVTNPRYAATAFFGGADVPPGNPGLLDIPGWTQMAVTEAAQAVQRSGFPDAYAKWEPTARTAVAALGGTGLSCAETPPASTLAAKMVDVALDQVGWPYVWGGESPAEGGFDCSGLIFYSWQQVGVTLPARVARDMHDIAVPIDADRATTGDMIFTNFGDRGLPVGDPGHIMLVVQPGILVEALTTGTDVRVRPYDRTDPAYKFGRFPASVLQPTR